MNATTPPNTYTASKSDTLVSESVGIVVIRGINTVIVVVGFRHISTVHVTLLDNNLSPVATSPSNSATATTFKLVLHTSQ